MCVCCRVGPYLSICSLIVVTSRHILYLNHLDVFSFELGDHGLRRGSLGTSIILLLESGSWQAEDGAAHLLGTCPLGHDLQVHRRGLCVVGQGREVRLEHTISTTQHTDAER